jgi:hypothetical protein
MSTIAEFHELWTKKPCLISREQPRIPVSMEVDVYMIPRILYISERWWNRRRDTKSRDKRHEMSLFLTISNNTLRNNFWGRKRKCYESVFQELQFRLGSIRQSQPEFGSYFSAFNQLYKVSRRSSSNDFTKHSLMTSSWPINIFVCKSYLFVHFQYH